MQENCRRGHPPRHSECSRGPCLRRLRHLRSRESIQGTATDMSSILLRRMTVSSRLSSTQLVTTGKVARCTTTFFSVVAGCRRRRVSKHSRATAVASLSSRKRSPARSRMNSSANGMASGSSATATPASAASCGKRTPRQSCGVMELTKALISSTVTAPCSNPSRMERTTPLELSAFRRARGLSVIMKSAVNWTDNKGSRSFVTSAAPSLDPDRSSIQQEQKNPDLQARVASNRSVGGEAPRPRRSIC